MKIKLKKNEEMKLQIPEFNCDYNPLGDHLNKYDMLKNLNSFSFNGIIGKPGSGKTSLLLSFLTGKGEQKIFRKVFTHILLVMPTSSRNSLKKNIFEKHPDEKMYEELTPDSIDEIYNKLDMYSKEGDTTLLILDDVGASLKDYHIQKTLRKIIFNRRHLKCQIFTLLQSFMSIPKEVRKLYSNLFMFKPSKVEFQNLFDELFETKKDDAMDIMRYAFDKPHQFLMMNIENQRLFKGFDELLLKEIEEN